jgi:uncharacterized protein YecT (DUF1311 family)
MTYLAGAVFALLPLAVSAQEVDCANAMAQQDLNACAYADWEAADAELNAAYQAARAVLQGIDADLPADDRGADAQLKIGQKAWITFRDATCAAEGYVMHGGSAEPLLIYGCMARLTEQRSADLRLLAAFQ